MKESNSCLVCGASIIGLRLGVDACRSCALFFKRSVGKSFICRQNNRKCSTSKDNPFMCRRCRFDKCASIGMRAPKGVIKRNDTEMTSDCTKGPIANSIEASDDDIVIVSPAPDSMHATTSTEESIMDRMGRAYRICRQRRIENERCLRKTLSYINKEVKTACGEVLHLCTNDFLMDSLPMSVTECINMTNSVFSEFAALTAVEQHILIKACAGAQHYMEMNYFTEKYFPGDDRYQLVTHTSCFDIERMDVYFSIEEPKEGERTVEFYTKKCIEMSRPAIREADLTETEFYAALCIIEWNFGHDPSIPPHLLQMGEDMVKRICAQLGRYYKDVLKCDDYALRLGRLLSLIHSIQETGYVLQEQFQLYKLLGIVKDDDLVMKMLI